MNNVEAVDMRLTTQIYERKGASQSGLLDLIEVLRAHPGGLRRWSVMRAMRAKSEKAGREVTPKFEDGVERTFRRHCAGDPVSGGTADIAVELFYRPKDKAGEVWAVDLEKVEAWLGGPNGAG